MLGLTPLGRLATIQDFANRSLLLASDEAVYNSGNSLHYLISEGILFYSIC